MTNKKLFGLMGKLGACHEALNWIGERNLATAWAECERADWMLWLCARMEGRKGWPTHQQVVLAACSCAATALRFVPKGEQRPARAIATARRWARGKATIEEVRHAAYADSAAYVAAGAADAAYAAASAAYAAGAADAAASAAYAAAHKKMCRILRRMLAIPGGKP